MHCQIICAGCVIGLSIGHLAMGCMAPCCDRWMRQTAGHLTCHLRIHWCPTPTLPSSLSCVRYGRHMQNTRCRWWWGTYGIAHAKAWSTFPTLAVPQQLQDGFIGLRCAAVGGRYLQARKRAPHRLRFFSQHCGVWEQWEVTPPTSNLLWVVHQGEQCLVVGQGRVLVRVQALHGWAPGKAVVGKCCGSSSKGYNAW